MSSSMCFGELQEYAKYFRVYAVDILGKRRKSFPTQMPLTDNFYSDWLHDVLTKLNIRKANVVGLSLGGWMALNFAKKFPVNVNRHVLISPVGIGKQKVSILCFILWVKGRKRSRTAYKQVNEGKQLFSDMLQYQKCIRNGFQYRTEKISLSSDEMIRNLSVPCSVIFGGKYIILSSLDTIKRMEKLLTTAQRICLKGEGHALVNVTREVCDFLLQNSKSKEVSNKIVVNQKKGIAYVQETETIISNVQSALDLLVTAFFRRIS